MATSEVSEVTGGVLFSPQFEALRNVLNMLLRHHIYVHIYVKTEGLETERVDP